MNLVVNGGKHVHKGNGSLASLLDELGMKGKKAAVIINGEVIPKASHSKTTLTEGDKIDFIVLASGG